MNNPDTIILPINRNGLTKRDYFAVMAMQGLLSKPNSAWLFEDVVKYSVGLAEDLLKALEAK